MNKYILGILLAVFSSALWALGGNFTQYIFMNSDFNYVSLVFSRMLVTSLLFFLFGIYKSNTKVLKKMITNKKRFIQILIYSFFGMLGVQLPFYATIQYSTAPFATLMQFGAPVLVMIYLCIKTKKAPSIYEIFCTAFILVGVAFVITNGDFSTLTVDIRAIIWGTVTAFGYGFYVVYAKVFFKWPTAFLMGYSMFFGSLFILPLCKISDIINYLSNPNILIFFLLMVIIGTFLPFYFIIESAKYINPTLICLLAVVEPIVSLAISIKYMGEVVGFFQYIGILIVLVSISIISIASKENS